MADAEARAVTCCETIHALAVVRREKGGAASIDAALGMLSGVSAFLQCEFGPERAYALLTTAPDNVAERIARERSARLQNQE